MAKVIFEALIFHHHPKKLPAYYKNLRFIIVFTIARKWSLTSEKGIKPSPSQFHSIKCSKIFLILSYHLLYLCISSLPFSFQVFPQNIICIKYTLQQIITHLINVKWILSSYDNHTTRKRLGGVEVTLRASLLQY
jgi:hypothetical protein